MEWAKSIYEKTIPCELQEIVADFVFRLNYLFSNHDFYRDWKAIKNGLYKASTSREKENIIKSICDRLNHLFDDEITMAKEIIAKT